MPSKYRVAFVGGLIGSVAVVGAIGLLVFTGQMRKAPFVASWQSLAGGSWQVAALIGGLLFVLIGALWAVPLPALVANPTVGKGVLWGLLPTLWAWTFVPAVLTGGPMFGGFTLPGLLIPVLMNCVIWGSIVGWYVRKYAGSARRMSGYGHT